MRISFRPILVLAASVALFACSMEKKEGGFSVRLGKPADSTALGSAFTELVRSNIIIPSGQLQSIGDLGCFGVNVRGGPIPASGVCGGVSLGISDGMYQGISSVFSPVVPTADGLVFEAYGTPGSSCPALNSVGSTPATLYFLGQVTADVTQVGSVVIPVSFNSTSSYSCGSTGPILVFADNFNYPDGSLGSNVGTASWQIPNNAPIPMTNGKLAPAAGTTVSDFWTGTLNPPQLSLMRFSVIFNVSAVGGSSHIILGAPTGATGNPAAGAACDFNFSSLSGSSVSGNLIVGGLLNSLVPSVVASGSVSVPVASRLVCDISPVAGTQTVNISAYIVDSSGNQIAGPVTANGVSVPCANCPTTVPYIYVNPYNGTTVTLNSYFIEQSAR